MWLILYDIDLSFLHTQDVSHYQPTTSDVMEKKDPVYETIQ